MPLHVRPPDGEMPSRHSIIKRIKAKLRAAKRQRGLEADEDLAQSMKRVKVN